MKVTACLVQFVLNGVKLVSTGYSALDVNCGHSLRTQDMTSTRCADAAMTTQAECSSMTSCKLQLTPGGQQFAQLHYFCNVIILML
jgi:hypothetical protein